MGELDTVQSAGSLVDRFQVVDFEPLDIGALSSITVNDEACLLIWVKHGVSATVLKSLVMLQDKSPELDLSSVMIHDSQVRQPGGRRRNCIPSIQTKSARPLPVMSGIFTCHCPSVDMSAVSTVALRQALGCQTHIAITPVSTYALQTVVQQHNRGNLGSDTTYFDCNRGRLLSFSPVVETEFSIFALEQALVENVSLDQCFVDHIKNSSNEIDVPSLA